jgi:iron complex outermembrane receptor protein
MKYQHQRGITSALLILPWVMAWPLAGLAAETEPKPAATLPDVVVMETIVDPAEVGDLGADGRPEPKSQTNFASSTSKITRKEIDTTNAVTAVDPLNYAGSGIFTRQRYIGDNNAPVSMRGSNPYQEGRVIVNVDGMPIWDPFDTSYSSGPRFNLVGPGEIKSLDIMGGPFAAEYSGNAMGGVINYNTRMPQKREFYTEATYMNQPYSGQGTTADLQGFKTFGSYGDKFGDFSSFFSYNHLENEGQPMTPAYQVGNSTSTAGGHGQIGLSGPPNPAANGAPIVSGGITTTDPHGNSTGGPSGATMVQYGSDGVYHSSDNLFKWKGGYDINKELNTIVTLAFDNLDIEHTGVSFLTNPNGTTNYASTAVNVNGYGVTSTALGQSQQIRNTLTMAWTLNGRVTGNWFTHTNISYFDILHDTTLASTYNPNDPKYLTTPTGTNTSWDNTGWFNLSSKWNNEEFLDRKDLSIATGYEFQHAAMFQTVSNLSNYSADIISSGTNPTGTGLNAYPFKTKSGGVTDTQAIFGQLSWRFLQDWDATPGVRLERWNMYDGTYLSSSGLNAITNGTGASTTTLASSVSPAQALSGVLNPVSRQASNWSPKFSLGWKPGDWDWRFSVAKAYRYPTDAELFGNSSSVNGSVTLANGSLKPEDGTHYNLYSQYNFPTGFIRGEIYHEDIRNAIYSQYIYLGCQNSSGANSTACPLSSMMASIGQVSTDGADLTANFDRVMNSPVDVKFNGNFVNAIIVSNPDNPSIVGSQMPLMPHWRTNLLTTYHYGNDLDFTVGTRYNSDMHSQVDNKDNNNIYNYTAFTAAYYVDLKATYRFAKGAHFSAGVNNLNDYSAYFNHPLPQRSFFAQIGYKF